MTPAKRVILATLADVYEDWPAKRFDGLGPYGVAAARLGMTAWRVAQIEREEISTSWLGDYSVIAARIRERLG